MIDFSPQIANLLMPLTSKVFWAEYYCKRPVVMRHPGRTFATLASLGLIARVLNFTAFPHPGLRVVLDGRRMDVTSFADVLDRCRSGATLIINDLDRCDHDLAHFSTDLAHELGVPIKINMYFSQDEKRGFATHYDTHDSFILQVEGEKRWRVYADPLSFPVLGLQREDFASGSASILLDEILGPGDVLYLPRGYWHDAVAQGGHSIHLNVGLYCISGADFLRWLVEELTEDVDFRRALPLGPLESEATLQKWIGHVSCLSDKVCGVLQSLEILLPRFRRHRVAIARPAVPLRFPEYIDRVRIIITPDTVIARPTNQAVIIERDSTTVTVIGSLRTLTFDASAHALLQSIFGKSQFTVADIRHEVSDCTMESVIDLLRTLVHEGLLNVQDGAAEQPRL